ncbi:MAG: heptosyltransferase II, partial [bacterium]
MTLAADDSVRTILAFRNGSIGNTMVAVPALRALKRRHPGARLVVVVDPVGRELLAELDIVDRLIVYDRKGRHRGLSGWLALVMELRREKPSHAILFKRFFRNQLLAFLSGAGVRAGFVSRKRARLLNRTIDYREGTSITRLNLELAALLGADPSDTTSFLPLSSGDRDRAQALLSEQGLETKRYLVGHYGGLSTNPSFLPPAAFRRHLEENALTDEPILLVGAGARELEWAAAISKDNPRVHCLLDQPVRVTAALIESARFFVGMNSGPAHLAAAVGTPALILFRPGSGAAAEVAKWRPESPTAEARIVPLPELRVG